MNPLKKHIVQSPNMFPENCASTFWREYKKADIIIQKDETQCSMEEPIIMQFFFLKKKLPLQKKRMSYFCLQGAYNEVSLYNSPNPIQDMKYPCTISYPFLSQFSSSDAISPPLPTHYQTMHQTYQFHKPSLADKYSQQQ